jgi:hypothetical protein
MPRSVFILVTNPNGRSRSKDESLNSGASNPIYACRVPLQMAGADACVDRGRVWSSILHRHIALWAFGAVDPHRLCSVVSHGGYVPASNRILPCILIASVIVVAPYRSALLTPNNIAILRVVRPDVKCRNLGEATKRRKEDRTARFRHYADQISLRVVHGINIQCDVRDRRTRNKCHDYSAIDGHASDAASIGPKESRTIGGKISKSDVRRGCGENDWRPATERDPLDLRERDSRAIIVGDEVAIVVSGDISPDNISEVEVGWP